MPHCIFEYSANIADEPDWPQILKQVHQGLISTGQFVAGDIKSRVIRHDDYRIGNGEDNQSSVTVNLQILDGRSDEIKREISRMVLEILVAAFPKSLAEQKCSITVQISKFIVPAIKGMLVIDPWVAQVLIFGPGKSSSAPHAWPRGTAFARLLLARQDDPAQPRLTRSVAQVGGRAVLPIGRYVVAGRGAVVWPAT